jgi:hypothetical protein
MRRAIVNMAGIGMAAALTTLSVSAATIAARAGETQSTKWRESGFACVFNGDDTTTCRFEVNVKNKMKRANWFRCKARVEFTTMTWRGTTKYKRIPSGEWRGASVVAEKVPEGEIVESVKWTCWQSDR